MTTLLFLFAAVWRPVRGLGPLARFAPAMIAAIVMSGLIVEILQDVLTTLRGAELGDWVADVVGVLVAVLAHGLLRRVAESPRPPARPDVSASPNGR